MLGIKENNNPIDIKYLTKALRDAIHKHPEREEYYKITFKDIYIMEEFQKSVNTSISMNFGKAIEALKAGSAIRRSGWNGKGLFVVKQVPSHITGDIIPKMQSLPQSAKDILMSRENPHIDYTNQMLIINPDGRADSWVPSSSDIFAEDWEIVE